MGGESETGEARKGERGGGGREGNQERHGGREGLRGCVTALGVACLCACCGSQRGYLSLSVPPLCAALPGRGREG